MKPLICEAIVSGIRKSDIVNIYDDNAVNYYWNIEISKQTVDKRKSLSLNFYVIPEELEDFTIGSKLYIMVGTAPPEENFSEFCRAMCRSLDVQLAAAHAGEHLHEVA